MWRACESTSDGRRVKGEAQEPRERVQCKYIELVEEAYLNQKKKRYAERLVSG